MNKFLGSLIIQNIILIYLILFIPIYLYLKPISNIADYEFVFLIIYVVLVAIIALVDTYLVDDKTLSFGFLRFYPFLFLLKKLNSVLKKEFPSLSISIYQKYIIIIHLMNRHAILTEDGYTYFSKLIKPPTDEPDYEFSLFIETPFWYELQKGLDQYSLNRQLLTEKNLTFNEKSFALKFFLLVFLYLILVVLIYLKGIFF